MKVKELVQILKKIDKRMPVIAAWDSAEMDTSRKTWPLGMEFEKYDDGWSDIFLKVNDGGRSLDTDMLKYILDWCLTDPECKQSFFEGVMFGEYKISVLNRCIHEVYEYEIDGTNLILLVNSDLDEIEEEDKADDTV